jgi:hypothetical protein
LTLRVSPTHCLIALLAQGWVLGCDRGNAFLGLGPRPRIVDYEPKADEGLDCGPADDPACGFPVNRPLRFVLDRWLLPSTATRQSVHIGPVGYENSTFLEPAYEMVTRTVQYRPVRNWDQGFVFDLQLFDPTKAEPEWGFRAYDGQWLDPENLPAHILFRVGDSVESPNSESREANCLDALQAFASAGCSASNCHRKVGDCGSAACQSLPRAGLSLDTQDGLADMIGRVARATDRGAESGVAYVNTERFGVNMALVRPGDASLSLLMYRLLLDSSAYRGKDGTFAVEPPIPAELERARSWLGVMGAMPPPEVGWPSEVSPIDLVSQIENWVLNGADTERCE